jgi:hypothetical protein
MATSLRSASLDRDVGERLKDFDPEFPIWNHVRSPLVLLSEARDAS